MNQYYVYILLCKDRSLYTGVTNDLERRKHEHDIGCDATAYTFDRRPLSLVYFQIFEDIRQAISFEKQIKGWSRKKKLALIDNNWDKIKELSICKNQTSHRNFNIDKSE
jgi:putative endonuclease